MAPADLQTYSINTAARKLDRSRRWVYYQMQRGRLDWITDAAGCRRITHDELARFIDTGGNDR
jgi:hypothetical protein